MLLPIVLTLLMQVQISPSCHDGERWEFHLRPGEVEQAPLWAETADAPPLSPRAALRSARAFLARMKCGEPGRWELHRLSLQPIAGQSNAWIYLVEFVESPRTSQGAPIGSVLPRQVSVVVLLDGRVVAPTVGRRQDGS